MTFPKIAVNTLIGSLVTAVGLAITLGPATAGILFAYSIICTLGIGAVFWIALAFGVGWLITTLWAAIRGDHAPSHPESTPQSDALTTYVRRALESGANDDQLLRRLERQGWTEDEIAQAIQRVQNSPDASNASGAA